MSTSGSVVSVKGLVPVKAGIDVYKRQPVGTAIQSGGDGLLLVEVFLYHEAEKHWNLDSMLSGQSQLTIRDGDHIYHISTMDPSSSEPNRCV